MKRSKLLLILGLVALPLFAGFILALIFGPDHWSSIGPFVGSIGGTSVILIVDRVIGPGDNQGPG